MFPMFQVVFGPIGLGKKVGMMGEQPKLQSANRGDEIALVDRSVSEAGDRKICYQVVNAVIDIQESGRICSEHLDAFTRTLECRSEFVFTYGGRRLVQYSHVSEEAADRLLSLMAHSRWRVRFNVVAVMNLGPPAEIVLAVLKKGLEDVSKRVRNMAVRRTLSHGLSEMIPALEQRRGIEQDGHVRTEIGDTIDLLRGRSVIRNGVIREIGKLPTGEIGLIIRAAEGHLEDKGVKG